MSAKRSVDAVWSGAKNREMRGSFFLPREQQDAALERLAILGQLDDFDAALRRGGCGCEMCEERRGSANSPAACPC
jgi:hypothetical protein